MAQSADERRSMVERARLAEEASRWDDMASHMRAVVTTGRDLSVEERNLFANAYKNYIGAKRAAWRVISGIEQKIDSSSRRRDLSKEYRIKIEEELKSSCNDVLSLIQQHLMGTLDVENQIFYLKMQGDYYRYLAEFSKNATSDSVFDSAKVAYAQAYELAREKLSPAHPLRLGLVLNFSVFYFEILDSHDRACEMAREAVAAAGDDLSHLAEPARNDSSLIIQLMKDNVKIWSSEVDGRPPSHHHRTASRYH